MTKKGQSLGINAIVIAILAIIILILLILLFTSQIRKSSKSYFDIGEQAAEEADVNSCKGGVLKVRQCALGGKPPSDDFFWYDIGPLDCTVGTCWERGEPK